MTAPSWLRAVAAVMRREVAGWRAHPRELLLLAVLPLASGGLFIALLERGTPSELPVAVVDFDRSALSRRITRALDASPSMRVSTVLGSTEEAANLVRRGSVYGIVTVPADFENDLRRGRAPTVVVDYNAQWMLPGSLIRRDARTAAATLGAGVEIAARTARGEPASVAMARIEPVQVDARAVFNPQLNYGHFLLPAVLPAMLQIFVLLQAVAAVGRELRRATAGEWLGVAGQRPWAALAGKMALPTAWFAGLALAMLILLHRVMHVPMRGSWPVLAGGTVLLVLACQAVGVMLVAWTANLRLATSFAAFYGGVAFAFAGVTFPLGGITWGPRAWADLLPLRHYVSLAFEQAMRGAPVSASMPELCALSLFVAVPLALSMPRLATVLRDARCWGRL